MINTSENRSPFGPILEGHTDCHSEQISDFPSDQVLDDLHKKFVEYGANAKLWKRKCTLLLPEIQKHKIWEKKNFSSIYEYAAKLAGLSRETVDDGLRILKKN